MIPTIIYQSPKELHSQRKVVCIHVHTNCQMLCNNHRKYKNKPLCKLRLKRNYSRHRNWQARPVSRGPFKRARVNFKRSRVRHIRGSTPRIQAKKQAIRQPRIPPRVSAERRRSCGVVAGNVSGVVLVKRTEGFTISSPPPPPSYQGPTPHVAPH